jgi:glycosyltransferase involved in cell wall biosynthesis
MRVLMLTELYPPHIGGSEQYVQNLSRELVRRGHDVAVATVADGNEPSVDDDVGVRVHRVKSTTQRASQNATGRPYLPPFPDPDVVAALRRIVAEERPEVVHAHNWMVDSFVPIKDASGARLVMTLHDYSVVCAKRSLLYRGLPCSGPGFSKCLHCASRHYGTARGMAVTLGNWATSGWRGGSVDMFVPVSTYVATGNELAARALPHTVIPNFVPDEVVATADAGHPSLAALPDEPYWLYVGALSAHKGVRVLLDAYAQLKDVPPLVVLGRDSPDAPTAYPPNVIVLKDVPHAAVMAAWCRASVGVVPSLFPDPCPTVAMEAMAAAVPVVASATGGLPDLVADGETGILVPVGDVRALAHALQRLAEAPQERDRMAAAARLRAPQFMASQVVPRLERVYAGDTNA